MRTMFLAWRDPVGRSWFPVGRLTTRDGYYEFAYTRGAVQARQEAGFQPLAAFPDFQRTYRSPSLFPVFSNRLLPRSRPDWASYVEWLSAPEAADDAFALLARSGGLKVTDTFEVFPEPEPDASGFYHIQFFVHGLSHFPASSQARAEELRPGERLLLTHDFQNESDPRALLIRTAERHPRDLHLLGFCPRYLVEDVFAYQSRTSDQPVVTVQRVNPPPAPVQFRIRCQLTLRALPGFRPFSSPVYEPIIPQAQAAEGTPGPLRKAG
jgi:HIRAN domain